MLWISFCKAFIGALALPFYFGPKKNHPDFLMILRVAYSDSLIEIEPELR
jgi:hypothetical protein